VGYHSLTTTHLPNVNLPSSGQQVTTWLSAHNVSVTGGNKAQDPLVRDTTIQTPVTLTFTSQSPVTSTSLVHTIY